MIRRRNDVRASLTSSDDLRRGKIRMVLPAKWSGLEKTLVAGKLGDGLLGTVVIDQCLARGGGSDQCGNGGIVQRAR